MNNKLTIVLIILSTAMLGGAALVDGDSKNEPVANKTLPLNDMVGKPAPDFSLQDQSGRTFKLSEMKGKKTVLFFNEGIMCYPACWNQMAALGTDKKLNNPEVYSVSIVVDGSQQWDSAIKKMPDLAKGTILFDTNKAVSRQYGVLSLESSMHRGSTPGHTYIVIDKSGIVRFTYDDERMGIQNNMLAAKLSEI